MGLFHLSVEVDVTKFVWRRAGGSHEYEARARMLLLYLFHTDGIILNE